MRVAVSLTTLGVVGIVMSDASMKTAIAYLSFMVAGGAFLTPGLMDRRNESIVVASVPAQDLSPQDLSPQAHARPKDSPSARSQSHGAGTRRFQIHERRSHEQEDRLGSPNFRRHGQSAST